MYNCQVISTYLFFIYIFLARIKFYINSCYYKKNGYILYIFSYKKNEFKGYYLKVFIMEFELEDIIINSDVNAIENSNIISKEDYDRKRLLWRTKVFEPTINVDINMWNNFNYNNIKSIKISDNCNRDCFICNELDLKLAQYLKGNQNINEKYCLCNLTLNNKKIRLVWGKNSSFFSMTCVKELLPEWNTLHSDMINLFNYLNYIYSEHLNGLQKNNIYITKAGNLSKEEICFNKCLRKIIKNIYLHHEGKNKPTIYKSILEDNVNISSSKLNVINNKIILNLYYLMCSDLDIYYINNQSINLLSDIDNSKLNERDETKFESLKDEKNKIKELMEPFKFKYGLYSVMDRPKETEDIYFVNNTGHTKLMFASVRNNMPYYNFYI